ncbi:hypothetical protein Tco_0566368 [Tanacetum coccineum]
MSNDDNSRLAKDKEHVGRKIKILGWAWKSVTYGSCGNVGHNKTTCPGQSSFQGSQSSAAAKGKGLEQGNTIWNQKKIVPKRKNMIASQKKGEDQTQVCDSQGQSEVQASIGGVQGHNQVHGCASHDMDICVWDKDTLKLKVESESLKHSILMVHTVRDEKGMFGTANQFLEC